MMLFALLSRVWEDPVVVLAVLLAGLLLSSILSIFFFEGANINRHP